MEYKYEVGDLLKDKVNSHHLLVIGMREETIGSYGKLYGLYKIMWVDNGEIEEIGKFYTETECEKVA
jgi:hypothetical protein